MDIFVKFINETISLWLEMSPYLLLGILFAGLIHITLGQKTISRHLGKPGILAILKSTLFGIPLPVCSCGVIPIASSLRREGAHKSSVLAFLVSTPTTGFDSIMATYSLLGPLFAIFRPIASFISGITVGLIDYLFNKSDTHAENMQNHSHSAEPVLKKNIILRYLKYTFIETPRDLGRWLIFGTLLGGAITAFLPASLFENYFYFPFDFLVALIIGLPLYVCASGSIPIAASLIAKGFTPGAGLVFLIVGPATNTITMSFVKTKLGNKSFYIYLVFVTITAVVLGLIFNLAWKFSGGAMDLITPGGHMVHHHAKSIFGIILFILVLPAFFRKSCKISKPDLIINVPDMHCKNCENKITKALKSNPEVERVYVDLENKSVSISGKITYQEAASILKNQGYNPYTIPYKK